MIFATKCIKRFFKNYLQRNNSLNIIILNAFISIVHVSIATHLRNKMQKFRKMYYALMHSHRILLKTEQV
jgi:hypothetical protein